MQAYTSFLSMALTTLIVDDEQLARDELAYLLKSVEGVDIVAQPPGKRLHRLATLSGGERALVGAALLLALIGANPSPFCILDEVDAALERVLCDGAWPPRRYAGGNHGAADGRSRHGHDTAGGHETVSHRSVLSRPGDTLGHTSLDA